MEPSLEKQKKQKLNDGKANQDKQEQDAPPEQTIHRWTFQKDLTNCINFHSPIVSVNGDPAYWFKSLATGGTNNPYSLDLYDQCNTLLLAKVNGLVWGQFINSVDPKKPTKPKTDDAKERYNEIGKPLYDTRRSLNTYRHGFGKPGDHAEDAFLESFEQAGIQTKIISTLRQIFGGALFVTLKLSRSPCSVCTQKLLAFAKKDEKLHLRIKVQTLYEGDGAYQGASDVHTLIAAGVSVREWNVPLHAKKTVQKEVAPKRTKLGQLHELACWCPDSDDIMQDEYREHLMVFEKRTDERLSTLDEFLNKVNPDKDGDKRYVKEIKDGNYKKANRDDAYKIQTKLKPEDRSADWFLKKLGGLK
jgi:hypothetical protein